MNRTTYAVALISAWFGTAVLAAEPGTKGAVIPTTQPAAKEASPGVKSLIDKLADDDFHNRDDAAQELQKLGKEALPALKEALKSEDPSIRSYAEWLVPAIERKLAGRDRRVEDNQGNFNDGRFRPFRLVPGGGAAGVGGPIIIAPGVRHASISVSVNNGVKTVNVVEDGRKISIREDADGISMSVTEPKDGKDQTTDYKAKNAEELKKDQPEAYKLYEQYAARGRGRELRMRIGGAGIRGGIELRDIREQQRKMMDDALDRTNLPDAQRRQLIERLDNAAREQKRALEQLDRVRREMLEDLKRFRLDDEDLTREMHRQVERIRRDLLDEPAPAPPAKPEDKPDARE